MIAGSSDLPKFTATKEWCLMAENSVVSIKLKGVAKVLTVDIDLLNSSCYLFGEMLLSRIPRIVSSIALEARQDLQVFSHWN